MMQTGQFYGIITTSTSRMRCVFCGIYLPKANKCVEEHVNGTKHKENMHQMAENAMIFKNDEVFCKPCNLTLNEEESIVSHIEDDDHANWEVAINDLIDGEYINIDLYLTTESEEIFCEACTCVLNCDLKDIESHVNDNIHRSNVSEILKPLNGIFSVEDENKLWCKVCNESISNTPQSVFEHIDGDNYHAEWINEMEDLTEDHDISIEQYLKVKDEYEAYCNLCQDKIPCVAELIMLHINSNRHNF